MRQKRVKSYRKVMALYRSSFAFREPYQLLVDADFVEGMVKQKLEFQERLEDVCQGVVKPMITQCCMVALYALGVDGQAATDLAKTFERRRCNHFKPLSPSECLISMGGKDNVNRYLVATQSLELRIKLRTIVALPIIYLARSVILLEDPSTATTNKKQQLETKKLQIPTAELQQLARSTPAASTTSNLILGNLPLASSSFLPLDSEATAVTEEVKVEKKRKIKGPKGPNPLSVKKKTGPVNPNMTTLVPRVRPPKPTPESTKKPKKVFAESKEVEREKKRPRVDDAEGVVGTLASRNLVRGDGEGGEKKKRKRSRGKKVVEGGEGAAAVAETVVE